MSNKTSPGGIGFFSLMQLMFIGLKLADVINWSWFWVLSPAWISIIFVVLTVGILAWRSVK